MGQLECPPTGSTHGDSLWPHERAKNTHTDTQTHTHNRTQTQPNTQTPYSTPASWTMRERGLPLVAPTEPENPVKERCAS
jgi:hypothetical protein